ncbi:CRISPR-associated endonuclease Cas2 [Pontiella sp.]|uniref:CRISPR-associated endonuclease Cas2 n=1 Tax=Pontiella sp. TaxID=2837462 RepID=UPI0035686031
MNRVDEFTRYFPADPTPGHSHPAEKEIRHMLHLVAYDIANAKRLRLVAKTCEDFGVRVEYSVFECDLPPARFDTFWAELNRLIDETEDSLLAYRVCGECVKKTLASGTVVRPVKAMLYIL